MTGPFLLSFRGRLVVDALKVHNSAALALVLETDDPEAEPDGDEGGTSGGEVTGPQFHVRYSRAETLRSKDFAICTAEEQAELKRLMAQVRVGGPMRRTRRARPARRGRNPDIRRTVAHAIRAGGEPVRRAWKSPGQIPRRIVILCDISASMEPYARAMARFLHMAVSGRGRVEAFTIGTRLTRVTRELSLHDPDLALALVAQAVPDWSSGTRLGEALREFNDNWGTRGTARGAVTVILSDGWDRGDPQVLANEMSRLARVAYRVVWANPLKASPGYMPVARGMAAALPYVDDFVEAHSLSSLEALVEVLRK